MFDFPYLSLISGIKMRLLCVRADEFGLSIRECCLRIAARRVETRVSEDEFRAAER